MNIEAPAEAGHNLPFDAAKVADFADAAGEWLDKGAIETEEAATKLNDFLAGCRGLWTKLDTQRSTEKKPHWDAGQAVDTLYKVPLATLKKAGEQVKPLLTAWAKKKSEIEAEAKRKAEEAAAAEQAAAQKFLDAAAARNDVAGEAEAEQAAKDADKAAAAAKRTPTTGRVASATGGGRTAALRTYYKARIDSPKMAVLWALKNHPAEVDSFLAKLAETYKRHNSSAEVDGVTFIKDERIP